MTFVLCLQVNSVSFCRSVLPFNFETVVSLKHWSCLEFVLFWLSLCLVCSMLQWKATHVMNTHRLSYSSVILPLLTHQLLSFYMTTLTNAVNIVRVFTERWSNPIPSLYSSSLWNLRLSVFVPSWILLSSWQMSCQMELLPMES